MTEKKQWTLRYVGALIVTTLTSAWLFGRLAGGRQ